jgi:hypothetical protein
MPTWNKAATAQLKLKIAEGVVPTNPAELTNDYIYGTLSAVHFKDYHLTGPTGRASVLRRFRKAFDNIDLEAGVTGVRRGKFSPIMEAWSIFSHRRESLITVLLFSLSPQPQQERPRGSGPH